MRHRASLILFLSAALPAYLLGAEPESADLRYFRELVETRNYSFGQPVPPQLPVIEGRQQNPGGSFEQALRHRAIRRSRYGIARAKLDRPAFFAGWTCGRGRERR